MIKNNHISKYFEQKRTFQTPPIFFEKNSNYQNYFSNQKITSYFYFLQGKAFLTFTIRKTNIIYHISFKMIKLYIENGQIIPIFTIQKLVIKIVNGNFGPILPLLFFEEKRGKFLNNTFLFDCIHLFYVIYLWNLFNENES